MALPIAAILASVPGMLDAGISIYRAITGQPPPAQAQQTPDTLAQEIEALPASQRDQVYTQLLEARVSMQGMDTRRFLALTQGSAEQIRATARPQMALAAMNVVTLFAKGMQLLVWATVIQWAVLSLWLVAVQAGADTTVPDIPSVWAMLAEAAPVAEMIWAPLIASFWASVVVVKKYMGVRERDKAQEYEIQAGKPLSSAEATIRAAGGAIASIAQVIKGRNP